MFCLDANVFMEAWNFTYPPRIFRPLWELIAVHADQMVLIRPVFEEIEPISSSDRQLSREQRAAKYPVRTWIEDTGFNIPDIDETVSNLSIRLERSYEIIPESKGAGQVDITLIAYAKIAGGIVVTMEAVQHQAPAKRSNYKIPLVCSEEGVACIDFVQLLDAIGINM
ncbi:MAG: DUF4411 family protein [Spirochaetaceae bacterium]|nr:MAG: DUF4411 family protein [Spirochaetaceae bacterium]